MRYGLISDIHGNVHALRAAVAALRRLGIDYWICAGDVVGYGPHPNECVEMVEELGALVVAGNHELVAIGELPAEHSNELVHRSHAWTRAALSDDVVTRIGRWPRRLAHGQVVVAHGSLDDPEQYVSSDSRCASQLNQVGRQYPDARVLVLGHTHRQRVYVEHVGILPRWGHGSAYTLPAEGRCLVNPGSVGQSRYREWPPRARVALLDMADGCVIPLRISYDFWLVARDLHRDGRAYRNIHSPPRLRYTVAQHARRAVQGLRHRRR